MTVKTGDIFDRLLSAQWREVEFPVTRMRFSIAHDLVEHKSWGVDGARVEDTALAPLRFTFSIPLINGLTPGQAERWNNLYPTQMRKLANAFSQRDNGILQHPEFGNVLCKADKFDMDWDAGRRGGVDAEISFVETNVGGLEKFRASPVTGANLAAGTLDSATVKADVSKIFAAKGLEAPSSLTDPFSFTEAMDRIKAISDYPSLVDRKLSGKIDAIVYHAKKLGRSVDGARSPTTWPVRQAVEQMQASAFKMKEKVLAAHKNIGRFVAPDDTTLAGIARQIPGARVGDLITLNPDLIVSPEIPKGTVIRYYIEQQAA